jgi:hypothetical protein
LWKDFDPAVRYGKNLQFSAGPQKNSPHNIAQQSSLGIALVAFPPIHSAHHNKKSVSYWF